MNYYEKKLYLAQVDHQDKLIKPIERWKAHEKGICHLGFTTILIYNNQVILQHRKHPAFDGFYDLTFSSHPIFIDGKLQPMEEAIYNTLEREWNLAKKDLKTNLKYLDKFYYQAKDPNSIYIEHEVDYLYVAELNKLPDVNKDFAYGFKLIKKDISLASSIYDLGSKLAPWTKKINLSKFF